MAQDLIRYDVLAQEAFRGVVRKVLTEVAHAGLPGDHHFYVTFSTRAPGVRLSSRLREQHPEEMTIVLQHQYWDLTVTDYAFEVGLSFAGIPERLLVPFNAIRGFFDPSVEFAVTFPLVDEEGNPLDEPAEPKPVATKPVEVKPASAKPAPLKPAEAKPVKSEPRTATLTAVTAPAEKAEKAPKKKPEAAVKPVEPPAPKPEDDGKSADVVSLDAFRKKP